MWTCVMYGMGATGFLVGTVLLALGIATSEHHRRYTANYDLSDSEYWTAVPSLLAASGVILDFISLWAMKKRGMSKKVASVSLATAIVIVVTLITAFVHWRYVLQDLETTMLNSMLKYNHDAKITKAWDNLQDDFPKCCGTHGPEDWLMVPSSNASVPFSCCTWRVANCSLLKSQYLRTEGCYEIVILNVYDLWKSTSSMAVAAVAFQVVFITFGVWMDRRD